jgi:hypothetical protein
LKARSLLMLLLIVGFRLEASAQAERSIGAAVSYISSGSIYLDAGRTKGLAQGDTVTFVRAGRTIGRGFVIAVSSSSSAVHLLVPETGRAETSIALGDSGCVRKVLAVQPPEAVSPAARPSVTQPEPAQGMRTSASAGPSDNIISGRVAVQYAQAGAPRSAPDFSQPSAYTRLNVGRLFGTGMNLSFFARTYGNASQRPFEDGKRYRFRLYDLSLSYDEPQAVVGWNVGRVTSMFMGGLGQLDGAQAYVKIGSVAVGVLGGFQPDYLTSGIETRQQKGALFVHYGWEGDQYGRWDATVAYGRQWYDGKLDRDFLYLQNTARLGMDLFLYQSTEIDVHVMQDGIPRKKLQLTNTFATLSYLPLSWMSVSAGFDATRNIYLLESMKTFPDTLFDHSLKEGYRGSLSVRIPFNVTLTAVGRYRPASGLERRSRSIGGGARIFDVAGSGVNLGCQYNDLTGAYISGKDLTIDLDDWITSDVALMLRYDRYAYTVVARESSDLSTTGSAMVQWRISRALFWLVSYDRVWDSVRDNERLMCELGFRF